MEPIESAPPRCTDDENLGSYCVVAAPPTFWTGGVDGVGCGSAVALLAANDDNAAAATTPIPDMDDSDDDMDDNVGEAA